jgi:ABC-2 type transport system permease protein
MGKVATIAIREFLETIRTKMFIISVVLMPLLILGFVFGAQWIAHFTERQTIPLRRIALADETGLLGVELHARVAAYNERNPQHPLELNDVRTPADLEALAADVRQGKLYAYLRIPAGVIEGEAKCQLGWGQQQLEMGQTLERIIQDAVFVLRCQKSDPPLDPVQIQQLQREVELLSVDVTSGKEEGKEAVMVRFILPFAVMFLLFMGTMQISFGLLTSLIEEKSSRVVEVLLSAVSPLQLMAGKIAGMITVGALLLVVWGGVAYVTAQARGFGSLVSGAMLGYAALYFVPGFLLLSSILGAVGSACNTLKEAQSMASPITILNIVPMVLWFQISQNPGSLLPVLLSYIPPITPFVMILRLTADPHTPLWQIITTLALLWASVFAMIWAAAKIFRVGILMYGKQPSLRELLRWVRYA